MIQFMTVVCLKWTDRNSLMWSVYVYTVGLDVSNDILQFTVCLFYKRMDGWPFIMQVIKNMYMLFEVLLNHGADINIVIKAILLVYFTLKFVLFFVLHTSSLF